MTTLDPDAITAYLEYLTDAERAELDELLTAPIEIDYDLPTSDFTGQYLKIMDKRDQVIPLTLNAIQADLLTSLEGRDIVVKARQMGVSTGIQARFEHQRLKEATRTLTLMDKADNTDNMREMAKRFYDNLPHATNIPERTADSAVVTKYANGSRSVMATAGSVNTGRSGSYRMIHGSEVAFWKEPGKIVAGALQAGSPELVVLESTGNGAQGDFFEMSMNALRGKGVWKLHFYPWFADPTYRLPLEPGEALDYTDIERALIRKHGLDAEQIKWRRKKIDEVKDLFPQEYPETVEEAFIASGLGYFGDIAGNFNARQQSGPISGHVYVAGLDWGQQNDFTVLSIWDVTAQQQVALLRVNLKPYADIRRDVLHLLRDWRVQTLVVETNSAGANVEALITESYAMGIGVTIIPFTTTNASKNAACATLREYLDNGFQLLDIEIQRLALNSLQRKQSATNVWTLVDEGGHTPDEVIANMLAAYTATVGKVLT